MLHLLHELLQKQHKWQWTKVCSEGAKCKITSAPVLAHFDPALPIVLAGDASAYRVEAVISYSYTDGSKRPIAYASRTLSAAERNYA